ncbi:MAG: hypothetical protein EBT27_04535 [Betaproteobacteria bacterium]|nr:hypothetical protein [Betaproteobacteria bacterium]
MKYQIGLYESPRGALVADHTALITQLQWATDTGGDKDLTYTALIAPRDAMALFDRRDILHVQVSRGGEVLWQGRVTGAGVSVESATSVRIQALGYRTAMYDLLYTAMWRTTDLRQWYPEIGVNPRRADLYNLISSESSIGLSVQARRYTVNFVGKLAYELPSNSARTITTVRMTLRYNIPSGMDVIVQSGVTSQVGITDLTRIVGPATSFSTTISHVLTGGLERVILLGLEPTTNVTIAATDDHFVRASSVTLSTRTASTSTTALGNYVEVVQDLVDYVNLVNPQVITASTAQLSTVGGNWETVVYEDQRPGAILDEIVRFGDGTTLLEWGVDQQRTLYMRPVTDVRQTWQVELDSMTLDRLNTDLYNSAYSVSQQPDGRTVRSSPNSDAASIEQLGLTREIVVDVGQTTDQGVGSSAFTNSRLNYLSTPIPQIAIVPSLVTFLGQIVEPYRVRAGDAVQLLSMPFIGVDGLARLRTFRVVETRYDAIADRIELTPESAPPRLQDVVRP